MKTNVKQYTGNERIDSLTFEELTNHFHFKINPIQTANSFEEILEFNKGLNPSFKLMIEIKATKDIDLLVKILLELFKKFQLYDKSVVASFNPFVLYKIRNLDPSIVTLLLVKRKLIGYLFHEAKSLPSAFEILPSFVKSFMKNHSSMLDSILFEITMQVTPYVLGVGILGMENAVLQEDLGMMDRLNQRGYGVVAWTVNEENDKKKLLKANKRVSILTDCLFE
jgi:glycerophosphoryl diester phosphodiesterase